jgi:hypothetical protein
MSAKRVIIDGYEWGISDNMANEVAAQIKVAMENGIVVTLQLLDKANRQVTVYFNGKTAVTAVVDLDTTPKPTEISG